MILTVASYKGGVGKTTTAVHLAEYLHEKAPTLLVDGDLNRSALAWSARGGFRFKVIDECQLARHARHYEHIVIDTPARPDPLLLQQLAEGCDLMILPTTPESMAMDALAVQIRALRQLRLDSFRVLLTLVPPPPCRDGMDARRVLETEGLPLFQSEIRRLTAFTRASLFGRVVRDIEDERAGQAWAAYEALGREIER
jgi:chromosome partitioning protein